MPAATAFSQIGQIASMRGVHEAFQWLHLHERQIMQWQVELVSIPAPPSPSRPARPGCWPASRSWAWRTSTWTRQAMFWPRSPPRRPPPAEQRADSALRPPGHCLSRHHPACALAGRLPPGLAPGPVTTARASPHSSRSLPPLSTPGSRLRLTSSSPATSAKRVKAISAACARSTATPHGDPASPRTWCSTVPGRRSP